MTVAIVIDKRAASVPAFAVGANAGFFCDVGERAVSVVVKQNIFSERRYVNIVEAVVVVVADADPLPPTVMDETGFRRDISKCAIAIILEKMRDWFLAFGKTFEAPAVHQKNIEPVVVVVVVESGAAACGFQ